MSSWQCIWGPPAPLQSCCRSAGSRWAAQVATLCWRCCLPGCPAQKCCKAAVSVTVDCLRPTVPPGCPAQDGCKAAVPVTVDCLRPTVHRAQHRLGTAWQDPMPLAAEVLVAGGRSRLLHCPSWECTWVCLQGHPAQIAAVLVLTAGASGPPVDWSTAEPHTHIAADVL